MNEVSFEAFLSISSLDYDSVSILEASAFFARSLSKKLSFPYDSLLP